MDTKQIELAARQYANKTQLMSNYPHDWQSSYDAYIQGATDALQPKQANEADTSDESEKVCDNWHCKDGVVMEQYGEKVYCDVCNGTGKLG